MFCSPPGRASAQLGLGRVKILRLAFQVTTASQQKKTPLFVFTSAPPATGQLLSRLITQPRDGANGGPLCVHISDDFRPFTASDARFRPPSLILFSLGDEETGRTRQRVIDKTARPLQLLAILRVGQSHQALPRSGGLNRLYKGEF